MTTSPSPFTSDHAGEAFLVSPPSDALGSAQSDPSDNGTASDDARGPGVLVLHSWWGLNDWTREFCRQIAAEGYTVLAPDMFNGETPTSETEGEAVLAAVDANKLSGLVMSSAHAARAASDDSNKPIAVIGFSMGASMALWISTKLPHSIGAVVSFYGAQSIDFDDSTAAYQGHYAEDDHIVSEDDRITTEAFIRMGENTTDFHLYEGTKHWFFEDGDNHDPAAAELAMQRLTDFLATNIGTN